MKDGLSLGMRRAVARFGVVATVSALVWGGVIASGMSSACTTEPDPVYFQGSSLGSCSGFTAKAIPASECKGCSGQAFALCNGTVYSECACELPSVYSQDAGTFEATVVEITDGGLTGFDSNGFGLPACCTGKSVLEIPASSCPSNCANPVGYAVCDDGLYTQCACSIPAGFALSTATCDGG
jgi:hypothetical protein